MVLTTKSDGTGYTSDQFKTYLKDLADTKAEQLGSGKLFRIYEDISIETEVELHGFTLIFAPGKKIYTKTANGHLKAGRLIDGVIIDAATFICERDWGLTSNPGNSDQSMLRAGSTWTTYGLTVLLPNSNRISSGGIFNLYEPNCDTAIFEKLTVEVTGEGKGSATYFNVNLGSGSVISIQKLRQCSFRYLKGNMTFVKGGEGWMYGERDHRENIKLAPKNHGSVYSFSANFPTADGKFQVFVDDFNFIDSYLLPDRIQGYPRRNNKVKRRIKRTLAFKPVDGLLNEVNGFSVRVKANRVVSPDGYPADSSIVAGSVEKYSSSSLTFGDDTIVTIWDSYYADGPSAYYNNMKYWYSDKDLEIIFRHPQYLENTVTTNTYLGAFDTTKNILSLDENYTNAPTPGLINYDGTDILINRGSFTLQDIYNFCKQQCCTSAYLDSPIFVSNNNGILDLGDKNIEIGNQVLVDSDDRFSILQTTGTITVNGQLNANYVRSDGKVPTTVEVTVETGISMNAWGIWPVADGVNTRTNIITGGVDPSNGVSQVNSAGLQPNTDYFIVADGVGCNRSRPGRFNTGDYGRVMSVPLGRIKKIDGTNLLPTHLSSTIEQLQICLPTMNP